MKIIRSLILAATTLLILAMAVGTFIEKSSGHDTAASIVYHSPWFIGLWSLVALLGVVVLVKWKMWKRLWVMLLHVSLLLILLGALLTHLLSREGTLHLRQGDTAAYFFPNDSDTSAELPFSLRLDTFSVAYHTGTGAPRDFNSHVTVFDKTDTLQFEIRMNHILSRSGYRFYQTSYDNDLRGTILTVAYDPVGLPLSYAAYALLGLSMMAILIGKWWRWRRSARTSTMLLILGACFLVQPLHARESIPTVNLEQAAKMERLQVSGQDRVMPLGTLARDFLLSIYGKTSYRGLTPTQVLAGWTLRPDAWKDQPMIRIKSAALRQRLGVDKGQHIAFSALFQDDGTYRVLALTADTTPAEIRKAAEELDEKVGLILLATRGELVQPAPTQAQVSQSRISTELLFNRLPHSLPLFIASFLLSILLFLPQSLQERQLLKAIRVRTILRGLLSLLVLYDTLLYLARWYIGGRIPLGNGPETMLFMSLCLLWVGLVSFRRQPLLTAPAVLMGSFTLLVAHLSESQPRIGGLMPVLQSPLLTIHVSVIMTAYALLALTCIVALVWLFTKNEALTRLSQRLLLPAVFLLSAGIFLGAVWAGVSWGTYWSWDPKEVWALITLLVYALPIHRQSLPAIQQPRLYHIYILCAFFFVLFTYFGVNYLLGGMHSYA